MNSSEEVDVVIVGGGVSGLSAAYRLVRNYANIEVVILEAKDRVGGRTYGRQLKAAKGTDTWDLGGQWIGSCQPHVMSMVHDLGLEVYKQYVEGRKVQQLGGDRVKTYRSTKPSMSLIALLDLYLFMKKVDWQRKLVPVRDPSKCPYADVWDSVTCDSMLRRYLWTKAARQGIESAVRCILGAEVANASWLYFLHYCNAAGGLEPIITADSDNSGQQYKIKGGAYQIADLLAKHLGKERIHFNTSVHTIEQGEKFVKVQTATGHEFRCKRVIVAIPPHQAAKIHYEPCLPSEKQLVLNRTQVGHLIKIVITYKTAFWRENGFSGEVVSNGGPPKVAGTTTGPICIGYDATSSKGNPALVAFIGGEQQVEHSKLSPEERKKAVLASYADYFGPKIHDYLEYTEKDWNAEPYNGGCPVSMCQPGVMRYMHPGLRLPFQRIHFAGTESATVWCGFINGAIQSGYRAANEVMYNLRPQSVTTDDLKDTCYAPEKNIKIKKQVRPKHVFRFTLGIGVASVLLVVAKKTYFRMLVG